MSGWMYDDQDHGAWCDCDGCQGRTHLRRHVPDDCLFDDNDVHHRYRDDAKQKRKR